MSESDAAPASEPPSAPAEIEDPSEVVRFLTHLSPTYAEPAKVCRRGESGGWSGEGVGTGRRGGPCVAAGREEAGVDDDDSSKE